jgi:O-antigen/teichoic acid export membrane protein
MAGLSGTQAGFSAASALVATLVLGATDRGLMVVGLTVGSVVAFTGGLGTGVALRSRYPTCERHGRDSLVAAYTWLSLAASIAAPLVAVAAVAASAGLIDERLSEGRFLLAVAVYTGGQVLQVQLVDAWFADGRFGRAATTGATVTAAGFLAILIGLSLSSTPASLLLAQGLGALAACAVAAWRLHQSGLFRLRPIRFRVMARMLRLGVPSLGLSAGLAIVMRADRYFLGVMAGPVAVGVYSLAGTISEMARLLPIATGQIMLHETSLGRGPASWVRFVRTALLVAAAGAALVGVVGWLLIPPVFGPEFGGAQDLLVILLVAEILFAPYAVASRGLLGGGWTRTAGMLGLVSAACAAVSYAVASHLAGAVGAAFASVGVYAILSAASWILLRRRFASSPLTHEGIHGPEQPDSASAPGTFPSPEVGTSTTGGPARGREVTGS